MTKTPIANQITCRSPKSILLQLNFGSFVPRSPFPPTIIPPRSIRLSPDKAQHPRITSPSPLGIPPRFFLPCWIIFFLLSFCPIIFPSFFPSTTPSYRSWFPYLGYHIETTHMDNLDNQIHTLNNSPWLNHAPPGVSSLFIYGGLLIGCWQPSEDLHVNCKN